jgi:hypothetical protein
MSPSVSPRRLIRARPVHFSRPRREEQGRQCPGLAGAMSRNATQCSSSRTRHAGNSPERILQKSTRSRARSHWVGTPPHPAIWRAGPTQRPCGLAHCGLALCRLPAVQRWRAAPAPGENFLRVLNLLYVFKAAAARPLARSRDTARLAAALPGAPAPDRADQQRAPTTPTHRHAADAGGPVRLFATAAAIAGVTEPGRRQSGGPGRHARRRAAETAAWAFCSDDGTLEVRSMRPSWSACRACWRGTRSTICSSVAATRRATPSLRAAIHRGQCGAATSPVCAGTRVPLGRLRSRASFDAAVPAGVDAIPVVRTGSARHRRDSNSEPAD